MIPRPGVNATAAATDVAGTRTDAGEVDLSLPLTPQRPGVGIAAVEAGATNAEMSTQLAAITSTIRIADQ